jgi:hypothetical protein
MTLRQGDLHDLVHHIMEIDSYKSKMGSDEDIITLSFSVKTKEAADDLETFLEKGYEFVLDSDATSGETSDGTYKVFVEIERTKDATQQILELADGVKNLTGLENIKFRYYKNWHSMDMDEKSLSEMIPLDPKDYGVKVTESNLTNYKNFFNRSFIESVDMIDDILTVKRPWADSIKFRFINFGDTVETINNINESFNANAFAEIIFLTKYIGDYNITKYGNKITLENNDKVVVLERIG